ncbi:hypothetical protein D3C85_1759590 [compost metagenome]
MGDQHQIVIGSFMRQGRFGEALVALLYPLFTFNGFAKDIVRRLAGPYLWAA